MAAQANSNVTEIDEKNGFHLLLLKVNVGTDCMRFFIAVDSEKKKALLKKDVLKVTDFKETDTILTIDRPEVNKQEIESAKVFFATKFQRTQQMSFKKMF